MFLPSVFFPLSAVLLVLVLALLFAPLLSDSSVGVIEEEEIAARVDNGDDGN